MESRVQSSSLLKLLCGYTVWESEKSRGHYSILLFRPINELFPFPGHLSTLVTTAMGYMMSSQREPSRGKV